MQEHTETVINTLEMHTCRSFCIPLFLLYFALYFSIYISTLFFLFLLRVSNRIQEFQVEILFEHFFDGNVDLRRDCDCYCDDGGVSVGVVVSGKAEKTFALL